ncbi:MAG: hypothetical protein QXP27_09700 [Candidatus Methanomethyliaceae archaeon]
MGNIFGLTLGKISHLHRREGHNSEGCPFCKGDMKAIANTLKEQGLKILRVGQYFVEIDMENTSEEELRRILRENKN